MKCTKKRFLLCILLLFMLSGCSKKFNSDDYIGKTSAEIIEKYGKFDYVLGETETEGLYKSTKCGYIYREKQVGFLGTSEEEYFFIHFDERGIAYECDYGVRPGG